MKAPARARSRARAAATVAPRQARVDGRRLRAERTRDAILEALLDLIGAGEVAPAAPQIAARAGVALRSIAQHFPSREDLFAAVVARYRDRAPPTEPVDPARPRAARVAAFVERRARILEATTPYRRTATVIAATSRAVAAGLREAARGRRAEVAAAFAPELARLPRRGRTELLDVLDAAAGGRTWDALREDQGLSPRTARSRLAFLLGAALAAAR